jgi:hypothetical protein
MMIDELQMHKFATVSSKKFKIRAHTCQIICNNDNQSNCPFANAPISGWGHICKWPAESFSQFLQFSQDFGAR